MSFEALNPLNKLTINLATALLFLLTKVASLIVGGKQTVSFQVANRSRM